MGLINDFYYDVQSVFKKNHVRKMLSTLNKHQTSGWEKWLQFELIRYYHDEDHEPHVECSFDKNLQHKPIKKINRLDLVYRKRNANTIFYNGVEIKVLPCPQYSIRGMLKDLSSVSQIKSSEWVLRSVAGLSVYSTEVMAETREYSKYKNYVEELVSSKRAKVFSLNGWTCLVVGWEATAIRTPDEMKKEYKAYLQSIGKIAYKWEIDMK